MGFQRDAVVLPRASLVGQDGHLGLPEIPEGGEVLPDPGVAEDAAGARVERRIDVDADEDRFPGEVDVTEGVELAHGSREGKNSL